MSLETIKKAIQDRALICPSCKRAILQFDKYIESTSSVWDGAGDSVVEAGPAKVTLICGNAPCSWKERTQYWRSYLASN